jgi:hypothetical protein
MSPRATFLGRRHRALLHLAVEAVAALVHYAQLLYSIGVITVIPGLAMVLGLPLSVTLAAGCVGDSFLICTPALRFLSAST